jgi:hypothetical protein
MGYRFYKGVFLVGALWNILGGAFIIIATSWIFSSAGLQPPRPSLYYDSWIALFVTFGIGYLMVYRDPYGNKNIVILGIIGKLAFSAIFLYSLTAFSGQVPEFFLIPVIGDLIFVVLFSMFLSFARGMTKYLP